MDNKPHAYYGLQQPDLETNQYKPAPTPSVYDFGCCTCSTKYLGIQIIKENWNDNYFKISNVVIGIFGILGVIISIIMYIHDPVPDDITFRYLFEQPDVGYPHHWNCFKYRALFCVLMPIQLLFAVIYIKSYGCVKNEHAGDLVALHIFNGLMWITVLVIYGNVMNSGVTPGGDYESMGITEEGFLLGKSQGCVNYMVEHHIFAYLAIHYVLFLPYTLCVIILAICLVYYIFYGCYFLLCTSYTKCDNNLECKQTTTADDF